jgi:membrane dipeptidase
MFKAITIFSFTTVMSSTTTVVAAESAQEHVARIHSQAIVIDTHSDYLDRSAIDGGALNEDTVGSQTTLGKLEQGQVDAQFFSVFVPPAFGEYGYAKRANELIDRLHREIARHPNRIELAGSVEGILRISNEGKIAALMGIEGGHVIENNLDKLNHFYDRGVRYMTLTWSNSNEWADSSGDVAQWGGLNPMGHSVVAKMNELGMMVDVSHVSDDTFWDVMAVTRSPVIASHSGVRAAMGNKRNMSDEMIRAVASNGGVIQVTFYARYVDQRFYDQFQKTMEAAGDRFKALETQFANDPVALDIEQWSLELALENELEPPPAARVVDHIDHIVQLVGIDHVGLGSDFDGMGSPPAGLEHIGKIATITDELVHRGYSDDDIAKVLGGNLLRAFAENERLAEVSP